MRQDAATITSHAYQQELSSQVRNEKRCKILSKLENVTIY